MAATSVPILVWIYLAASLSGVVLGKGGTGVRLRRISNEGSATRVYPSQQRIYYYDYYVSYFSPTGIYYAKAGKTNKRTVVICTNNEPYFDNATVLGPFPCPMESDPDEFDSCCGEDNYQYCCRAIDTTQVQLAIGLGAAALVGLLIFIVVCIVVKVRGRQRRELQRDANNKEKHQKGIRHYDNVKTANYSAEQSDDGYQIVVRFKAKKTFYHSFLTDLMRKNPDVAWRRDEQLGVTEGKIVFEDGNWVSLLLSDNFEGRPIMVVSREKAAVYWMETEFEKICHDIPNESSSICSCLGSRSRKVHPAAEKESTHAQPESAEKYKPSSGSQLSVRSHTRGQHYEPTSSPRVEHDSIRY